MVDRARLRTAFRQHLADQGVVPEMIVNSRMEIDQARLYVQKTAWLIDRRGAKGARTEIAGIKVAIPAMATRVIDRAIEVHGGAASATTSRWRTPTHGRGRCASSTVRTRSTGGQSPARS